MKKILPILNMLIMVAGLGYFLLRAVQSEQVIHGKMEQFSLVVARCEFKAQWIESMQKIISINPMIRTRDIELRRILSAVWEGCEKYDVPKDIVLALIQKESQFAPRAKGSDGEVGLCQIMPETAALINNAYCLGLETKADLERIENNVEVGILFLRELIQIYGLNRALAHYNHGRNGLSRRGQRYARDVLKLKELYAAP